MSRFQLFTGDCREWSAAIGDNTVDSMLTDPPYHLTQASRGGHARTNNPGTPHGRHRIGDKGFMGQVWDGGDVAFQAETWAHAYRVMKPGAILLAFGGTRTFHRLVCAIEDAGFEVRDLVAWVYANGFPKGTDKAKIPPRWEGWNTALKPALEPVCLARKPMDGPLAQNLERWGTGAMWIDGCRVPLDDGEEIAVTGKGAMPVRHVVDRPRDGAPIAPRDPSLGRWPANLIHDGSDEVLAAFPHAAGANAPVRGTEPTSHGFSGRVYGSAGTAERAPSNRVDGGGSAARFYYCAKASPADRNDGLLAGATNNHPTVKPTQLLRYLARLITPPGGIVADFFMGSGSTGKACALEGLGFVGGDLHSEHVEVARQRIDAAHRFACEEAARVQEAAAQHDLFGECA